MLKISIRWRKLYQQGGCMNKNVKSYVKSNLALFIISIAISYLCYAVGKAQIQLDPVSAVRSPPIMQIIQKRS